MDTQQANQPVNDVNQQPVDDDKELAKVLAGFSDEVAQPLTPEPVAQPDAQVNPPAEPMADPAVASSDPTLDQQAMASEPQVATTTAEPVAPMAPPASSDSDLDSIKEEVLGDLHPLIDKLNVAPKEKFYTYLLLLRSTDDKSLIAPAYQAARAIPDESQRAEALLDVIKGIDFLKQA